MTKTSFLGLLFLLPAVAEATLTFIGASGASRVDTTDPIKPKIYAGFAGTCNGDNRSTCDSCAANTTNLSACNHNNAYPTLILRIEVQSSNTNALPANVRLKINGTENNGLATLNVVNGLISAEMSWGTLCNAMPNPDNNCTRAVNGTLSLGLAAGTGDTTGTEFMEIQILTRYVDSSIPKFQTDCPVGVAPSSSNEGFCHFAVKPGDEKVYAVDMGAAGNYPATPDNSGVFYESLVFFHADDLNNITSASDYKEVQVRSDQSGTGSVEPEVVDNRIDGLVNGQLYCFRMGNKDNTGIIDYFSPMPGTPGSPPTTYGQCATPDEVFGLLDDKECFIATAAFGSDMAPEVQSFRKFRNDFLVPYEWGRKFVNFYYEHSPRYARVIASNEMLRTLARGALWPVLFTTKAVMGLGAFNSVLLFVLSLGGGIFLFRRRRGES